jgi:hypothetical protein
MRVRFVRRGGEMCVRFVRRGGEMCVRFVPGRAGGAARKVLNTHLFSIARSPDCSSPAGSAASAARTPARAAPHSAQHGQPATVLRDAPPPSY